MTPVSPAGALAGAPGGAPGGELRGDGRGRMAPRRNGNSMGAKGPGGLSAQRQMNEAAR